ncbi:hypothetical protein BC332_05785 [Capsicum chinense]|nr:hypothetical protein BC332_05785 [Capsicum chinense]
MSRMLTSLGFHLSWLLRRRKKLHKELSTLQTELDRQPPPEKNKKDRAEPKDLMEKQDTINANSTSSQETKKEIVADAADGKNIVYTVSKPQWLGGVEEKQRQKQETAIEQQTELQENDQFVDYKDRSKVLVKPDVTQSTADSGIETDMQAEDAVALLWKHSQRYHSTDDEVGYSGQDVSHESQTRKEKKKQKKVLGPERPSYLKSEDYDSWVPPEGQSGDGRTSLNDRLGN